MHKKSLRTFLIAGAFALIGAIIGIAIGASLYGTILPFWSAKSIGQTSEEAIDILFVDYQYADAVHLEGNTLYVETRFGEIYLVSQNNSRLLSPLPNENAVFQIRLSGWEADAPIVAIADQGFIYQMVNNQWETIGGDVEQFKGFTPRLCADEWHLPVTGVIDSAGTVFSHALADEYVCYVLHANGQLQVWTRTRDAFSLMGSLLFGGLIGLIAGFNTIPIVNYFRRVKGHRQDSSSPKAAQHSVQQTWGRPRVFWHFPGFGGIPFRWRIHPPTPSG